MKGKRRNRKSPRLREDLIAMGSREASLEVQSELHLAGMNRFEAGFLGAIAGAAVQAEIAHRVQRKHRREKKRS